MAVTACLRVNSLEAEGLDVRSGGWSEWSSTSDPPAKRSALEAACAVARDAGAAIIRRDWRNGCPRKGPHRPTQLQSLVLPLAPARARNQPRNPAALPRSANPPRPLDLRPSPTPPKPTSHRPKSSALCVCWPRSAPSTPTRTASSPFRIRTSFSSPRSSRPRRPMSA